MADQKYLAASVPRSVRAARLRQVRLENVIGSWSHETSPGQHFVFDVIMLTEREFMRARAYLAAPDQGTPSLQQGGAVPPYVLKDVKEVIVPADEANAFGFAKQHFMKEFGLDKGPAPKS